MGIFRRRRKDADSSAEASTPVPEEIEREDDPGESGDDRSPKTAADSTEAAFDRSSGPFDSDEVVPDIPRLDLGGLRVPTGEGLELRLDIDQERQEILAVTAVLGDSSVQMQAFAAPRSGGLWEEVRDELAASVVAAGGTVQTVAGPLGPELRARIPSPSGQARPAMTTVRFVGVDGPRWFLRGVLSGVSIIGADDHDLIEIFRSTVVVRGGDPMAPREQIPLTMPDTSSPGPGGVEEPPGDSSRARDLSPFDRGPEITEVR